MTSASKLNFPKLYPIAISQIEARLKQTSDVPDDSSRREASGSREGSASA
ncbi:MAG: hypothetical protein LT102_06350 [Burkholderiaceae bacterium]|nr:hypothetical protein [Burkholderiaceae bacterium]